MARFWLWRQIARFEIHGKQWRSSCSSWIFSRSLNYEPRDFPQNSDLPPIVPPRKKPFARPLELVIWEYKRDKRLGVRRLWRAPLNGMLIEHLIPMAHDVLKEYAVLEEGVRRLMKSIPIKACSCCMEIHIARVGHKLPTCRGTANREVYGQHRWIRGYVEDVIVPIEAYHVHDKLGPSIKHNQRYTVPRVPAIHELCMHAGVDDPRYPMIRWARRSGRQVGDGHAQVPLTRFRNVIVPGYSEDEASGSSSNDDDADGEASDEEEEQAMKGADEKMMAKREDDARGYEEESSNALKLMAAAGEDDDSGSHESSKLAETDDTDEQQHVAQDLGSEKHEKRNERVAEACRIAEEDEDLLYNKLKKLTKGDEGAEEEILTESKVRRWAEVSGTWTIADPTDTEKQELKLVAERTLEAFDTVRKGVQVLLYKYKVWACGYCSEVHVGSKPHKVRLCGGFGRGFRDGLHTWQEAALSDVFPPNFVWHVPEGHSPRLSREFLRYYGQAPAIVELCVQAGAEPPERWKPFMRMDVVIPDEQEAIWAA